MSKPTQREAAVFAYNEADFSRLRSLAEISQNAPPQGRSDGSISEDEWSALRELLDAERAFVEVCLKFSAIWKVKA